MSRTARDVAAPLGTGIAQGLMTIVFLAAIERIPLGTAVAIEFLGPLTVAAIRRHATRALTWPGLALLGVTLLTQPWRGDVNAAGILLVVLAGAAAQRGGRRHVSIDQAYAAPAETDLARVTPTSPGQP